MKSEASLTDTAPRTPRRSLHETFQPFDDIEESEQSNNVIGRDLALGATLVRMADIQIAQTAEVGERSLDLMTRTEKIRATLTNNQRLLRKETRQKTHKRRLAEVGASIQRREESLSRETSVVREKLLGMPERYRYSFNSNLEDRASDYLYALHNEWMKTHARYEEGEDEDGGLVEYLSYGDWVDWLTEASADSDERIIQFSRWYIHAREEMAARPELATEIEEQKKQYLTALENGVEEGWLHTDALDRVVDKIRSIEVKYADMFELTLEDRAAYAMRGGDGAMVFSPYPSSIRRDAKHEFNHVVLGRLPYAWLDEAVTEHVAQVFGGKRALDDFSPGEDGNDHAYRSARDLLKTIIDMTGGAVTMKDFTVAYSCKGHEEWDRLSARIDTALRIENALEKLQSFLRNLQTNLLDGATPKDIRYDKLHEACIEARMLLGGNPETVFGTRPNTVEEEVLVAAKGKDAQ